jgi:hypothetical protein
MFMVSNSDLATPDNDITDSILLQHVRHRTKLITLEQIWVTMVPDQNAIDDE